jgi:hypothetical protein
MLLIVKSLLSLLDMLFPETIIRVVNKLSPMKTIQPSINLWDTPEKYNGWHDWTTWNVALWINNDECFYNIAKDCKDYMDFLYEMQYMIGSFATPDGADWGEANIEELNEVIFECN